MQPVLWIDAVGLAPRHLGPDTPHLSALAARGAAAPLSTVLPAVTLPAQATLLTGTEPRDHGIVGNGWYWRDLGEVLLWRQPNHCVRGDKIYDRARELDASFTTAQVFWWWNMGARVEWSLTPRPYYPADGRKIPAVYGWPREYPAALEAELGAFPFFDFWGPKAGLPSSRWLADAALWTLRTHRPSLTMVYLPHLDYDHQRFGPESPEGKRAVAELDALVGELVAGADAVGAETVVVSEYALEAVSRAAFPNRRLREAGLLEVRDTPTGEVLDVFGSRAFCAVDHQVAHVYVADPADLAAATEALADLPGVARVLDESGKREFAIDHERAGELVLLAEPDAWFAYYYWLDDAAAPDFARTVDIHRKPGYDPVELFVDPRLKLPIARVVRRLAQKKLGFRYLMDVIGLDASLVRGSHGLLPSAPDRGPVWISSAPWSVCGGDPDGGVVPMTSAADRVLALLRR